MRLLIVEDDADLAAQVARAAESAGYVADRAPDGGRADFLVQTESYDAVILDLGLPVVDGMTLVRRWRRSGISVPVLVLTARAGWHDTVQAIDAGADDYVTKPFTIEVVLARVRALVRRAAGHAAPVLTCGALRLDPVRAAVTVDDHAIDVTSHEYRVLAYLMHHAARVVSAGELVEHLYPHESDRPSNTVEVFIARLRRKIGAMRIETVRGLGYRMRAS